MLWLFLCLICFTELLRSLITWFYNVKRDADVDYWLNHQNEAEKVLRAGDAMGSLVSEFQMVAHWIFAISYFELALKCQLFITLDIDNLDIERIVQQFKAKDRQVLILNIVFYTFFVVNTTLWLIFTKLIAIWYTLELIGM